MEKLDSLEEKNNNNLHCRLIGMRAVRCVLLNAARCTLLSAANIVPRLLKNFFLILIDDNFHYIFTDLQRLFLHS